MTAADLTALRELHRLISRSFSVHAAYAPALERAIEELDPPENAWDKFDWDNDPPVAWLNRMNAAVGSFERPRMLPTIKPGDPAPAGAHFEEHGDKLVFRSPVPYGLDTLAAKARPSIEERTATARITLAPGETFRNVTNAGKCTLTIPAHWPLPPDLDE